MRLAALMSGGKDSTAALHDAWEEHDIRVGVALEPRNEASYMFHPYNLDLVTLQARSIGIPLVRESTEGEKEAELTDLKRVLEQVRDERGVEGVVAGALESQYQKERLERVASELGLDVVTPLWHVDVDAYMERIVREFDVRIVGVAAAGLDASVLGWRIDQETLQHLREVRDEHGIHLAGEGGEYETLVCDAPLFDQSIVIDAAVPAFEDGRGVLRVEEAHLAEQEG